MGLKAINFKAELARKPVFASDELARAAVFHPHVFLIACADAGLRSWTEAAAFFGVSIPQFKKWVRGEELVSRAVREKLGAA